MGTEDDGLRYWPFLRPPEGLFVGSVTEVPWVEHLVELVDDLFVDPKASLGVHIWVHRVVEVRLTPEGH